MPSIVIAAHNEENMIGRSLDALLAEQMRGPREVIVSANGCTDQTVDRSTRPGVIVIDRRERGKTAALNAADRIATTFPRIYLDADILVPPGGVAALVESLAESPLTLAVVPRRTIDTAGRPWPVRAYYSINERLPVFRNGLFGRGVIVLSEQGRARFDSFPALIADDLFLDSQFTNEEKIEVSTVEVVVAAPFTTRALVRRLVRVRRGNAEMRAAAEEGRLDAQVRSADRWSWWRDVVLPNPRLLPAALPYLVITLVAGALARRTVRPGQGWGRDESTRGTPRSPAGGASA